MSSMRCLLNATYVMCYPGKHVLGDNTCERFISHIGRCYTRNEWHLFKFLNFSFENEVLGYNDVVLILLFKKIRVL